MAKKQVQPPVKLSDLTPDPGNYNAGTEEGQAMLERSLQKLGFGRSILLDKHGRVLAGNKTLQGAQAAGFADEDLQVIQTDGKKVIALQRMDLDLDTQEGKNMALADNAVAKTNINWDFDALGKDGWTDETLGEWGVTDWQGTTPGEDYEPDVNPNRVAEAYETYTNNNIRQVVLYFEGEQYGIFLEALDTFKEAQGIEDNTKAVTKLLEIYGTEQRVSE